MTISHFIPPGFISLSVAHDRLAEAKFGTAWREAYVEPHHLKLWQLHVAAKGRYRNGKFYNKATEAAAVSTPQLRAIGERISARAKMSQGAWDIFRGALVLGKISAFDIRFLNHGVPAYIWTGGNFDLLPTLGISGSGAEYYPLFKDADLRGLVALNASEQVNNAPPPIVPQPQSALKKFSKAKVREFAQKRIEAARASGERPTRADFEREVAKETGASSTMARDCWSMYRPPEWARTGPRGGSALRR